MRPVTSLPQLVDEILTQNPLQRAILDRGVAQLRPSEIAEAEMYIEYAARQGLSRTQLASTYTMIVRETLKEQLFFQRHGRYRYSTFAETSAHVLSDPDYMSSYMYGLALTSYLWPNHLQMRRFFEEHVPSDKTGSYLEIGPGHGLYFMLAMQQSAYSSFLAVDASPTSVELTSSLIASGLFGEYSGYEVQHANVFDFPETKRWNAVVSGEVLEHVERPDLFMEKIARLAADDAFIFITTCINAPEIDHLALFRTTEEVTKLFSDAGLRPTAELVLPYAGTTLDECVEKKLAINVAYVLTHR